MHHISIKISAKAEKIVLVTVKVIFGIYITAGVELHTLYPNFILKNQFIAVLVG